MIITLFVAFGVMLSDESILQPVDISRELGEMHWRLQTDVTTTLYESRMRALAKCSFEQLRLAYRRYLACSESMNEQECFDRKVDLATLNRLIFFADQRIACSPAPFIGDQPWFRFGDSYYLKKVGSLTVVVLEPGFDPINELNEAIRGAYLRTAWPGGPRPQKASPLPRVEPTNLGEV